MSLNLLVLLTVQMILSVMLGMFLMQYIQEILDRKKMKTDDYTLADTRAASTSILHSTIQKAHKILTNAELRGIKLFSKDKLDSAALRAAYESELHATENALREELQAFVSESNRSVSGFLADTERMLSDFMKHHETKLEDVTKQTIQRSSQSLDAFTATLHEDIKTHLSDAFSKVEKELSDYKLARIRILNQHIIDILEKTLVITLQKKLSLSDQTDLIYSSLEEAKKEHIF